MAERNPHLKIAGVVASAPLFGLPKDRNIDAFKIFGLKLVGDALGVSIRVLRKRWNADYVQMS